MTSIVISTSCIPNLDRQVWDVLLRDMIERKESPCEDDEIVRMIENGEE